MIKGKGWCIVPKKYVTEKLSDFVNENFEKVAIKQAADDETYFTYREGRVRRAVTKLRDTLGNKEPKESHFTISDSELRDANTQASRLGEHIPLAKIHKFTWLQEEHGDGTPLAEHFSRVAPDEANVARAQS